jgi:hypothetical protein
MADPVKTLFLRSIKEAIEEIASIKTVIRNPTKPVDRETVPFPVCFLFDGAEENEDRNRINLKTFELHIEVWVIDPTGDEAISDVAESIQAEIVGKLTDNPDLYEYGLNLKELGSSKFFVGEDLGGVIMRFRAQYAHKRGDATDPARGE